MVKKPKLKRDWVGRWVRLKMTIQTNGGTIFEAGEVLRVIKNYSGLELERMGRCAHCTNLYRTLISHVSEWQVELLPEDYSHVAVPPRIVLTPERLEALRFASSVVSLNDDVALRQQYGAVLAAMIKEAEAK